MRARGDGAGTSSLPSCECRGSVGGQDTPSTRERGERFPAGPSVAPGGDLETDEGPGERDGRPGEVDVVLGASGQPALGTLARPLRSLAVDLLRQLGHVGE